MATEASQSRELASSQDRRRSCHRRPELSPPKTLQKEQALPVTRLFAFSLIWSSRSSVRCLAAPGRTTEAPPRPSSRRGRISERPLRPKLTPVPLQWRSNASPFWITVFAQFPAARSRNYPGWQLMPNWQRTAHHDGLLIGRRDLSALEQHAQPPATGAAAEARRERTSSPP